MDSRLIDEGKWLYCASWRVWLPTELKSKLSCPSTEMLLPPEFLKLKRKRNEEPIELLCINALDNRSMCCISTNRDSLDIQLEGPAQKKSFTELKFQFERVLQDDAVTHDPISNTSTTQTSLSSSHGPRVPIVRATLPGEEYQTAGASAPQSGSIQGCPIAIHNETPLFQNLSFHPKPRADQARLAPRKFHLTPETMSQFHHQRSKNIRAYKRGRENVDNAPVFSERSQNVEEAMELDQKEQGPMKLHHDTATSTLSRHEPQSDTANGNTAHPDPPAPRKRPITTDAEKKWRGENWKTRSPALEPDTAPLAIELTQQADLASTQRIYESLKLARELQKFTEQQNRTTTSPARPRIPTSRTHLKFQPIPNPRRYKDRMAETAGMEAEPTIVEPAAPAQIPDDDDYVLETYVRKVNANTEPTATDYSHGIIVIKANESEIWEAFGEDEEEDEGPSDSEDSNAEDHYANDYPEGEMWRDDAAGRREYRFRNGASDDEEYDEDYDESTRSFSDWEEDEEPPKPLSDGE